MGLKWVKSHFKVSISEFDSKIKYSKNIPNDYFIITAEAPGKESVLRTKSQSEDYHFIDYGSESYRIIGIFDGHGGSNSLFAKESSQILINKIHELIPKIENNTKDKEIQDKLTESFKLTNKEIAKIKDSSSQGTTATIAIISSKKLYVAHVGDSPAYIVDSKNESSTITKNHNCRNEVVVNKDNSMLSNYGLQVTRFFGNKFYNQYNLHNEIPDVTERYLKEMNFILLASDGVSDAVENYKLLPSDIFLNFLKKSYEEKANKKKISKLDHNSKENLYKDHPLLQSSKKFLDFCNRMSNDDVTFILIICLNGRKLDDLCEEMIKTAVDDTEKFKKTESEKANQKVITSKYLDASSESSSHDNLQTLEKLRIARASHEDLLKDDSTEFLTLESAA
nr:13247_t:CDS:10 [Entrophospora candida]CAG8456686.1 11531_t:CDS:10 [Entrophospora candida]